MKVAIMQPYFFPYIGYFQLIDSADIFVFYDDVNYIKRGWINRNRLLVNGKEKFFTIELSKQSQNKLINETEILADTKSFDELLKMIRLNYNRAPNFKATYSLIEYILRRPYKSISELAISSVTSISDYLSIDTEFKISSKSFPETRGLFRDERLAEITKMNNSVDYINLIGGINVYEKEAFQSLGVNLHFLENKLPVYNQFDSKPISGLSIIDVIMFNSINETREMTKFYNII